MRARLGTAAHFCEEVVLKLRTVPIVLAVGALGSFFKTAYHPGGNPGANYWFLEPNLVQMPPELGGICGRLT